MRNDGRIVRWGEGALSVLLWLNIAAAVLFAVALTASFAAETILRHQLVVKYADRADLDAVIWGLRGLVIIGQASALAADRCLRALRGVLRSVRAGDPFDPVNAARVTTMGWALLVIQLLDLALGAVWAMVARAGAEVADGWYPSLGGWLSVLGAFVLARVFAAGAGLREEVEGTV